MRRADRLFQIVQYLRGGRLTTARSLAQRLEVSERTIHRDIADLIGSGVPIEGEAGVGYIMRAGYDVPPLMFTQAEVTALVAGARMARAWGGLEMARAAEEALVKIEAVLPQSLKDRAARVPIEAMDFLSADPVDRARLDQLEHAAHARLRVRFPYEDEGGRATTRTVRPLALLYWGKVWTLASWCELRQDFRMFRVDRMGEVSEGDVFPLEADKNLKAFYDCHRGRPLA